MTGADVMERWLVSGHQVVIANVSLKPMELEHWKGTPVVIKRGQAAAFPLVAHDGSIWFLKKFLAGREPDPRYLLSVPSILPNLPSFTSGTERRLLRESDVGGTYHPQGLSQWLNGTLLMRSVRGYDWNAIADQVRSGVLKPTAAARAHLVRSLARAIAALESAGCSHRDLSISNVFVDIGTWQVALIDWDTMFHASLPEQLNTSGGTAGYIAPFVYEEGQVSRVATWVPLADRFALTILCAEFLAITRGSPVSGEGGIFDQNDLCARSGATLEAAASQLDVQYPVAARLFQQAMAAHTYASCPPPKAWLQFAETILGVDVPPPALPIVSPRDFLTALSRRELPEPIWPAPPLSAMPAMGKLLADIQLSGRPRHPPPALPDDPFMSKHKK